jgi:N-methylhydantoinase B/oxoprolinase/acetone carboxylase alpha subunit
VQRGNIFTGAEEVLTFIQSYNTIVKKVLESEQRAMNNKQLSMNNEPLKATS